MRLPSELGAHCWKEPNSTHRTTDRLTGRNAPYGRVLHRGNLRSATFELARWVPGTSYELSHRFCEQRCSGIGFSATATLPSSRPTHSQHIPVCVYGLDRRDEGSRLRSRARADRTSSTPACRPLFIWPALAADVCARCSAMNNRSATKSLLAVARRENPRGTTLRRLLQAGYRPPSPSSDIC